MALEFRRARHLDVFIIAHAVHHGVRTGFLGALFEIHESGKKSDIARLNVVAAAVYEVYRAASRCPGWTRSPASILCRRKTSPSRQASGAVRRSQRRFDRQNVFVVARIGARGHQNGQDQRAGHGDGVRHG